jgi:photosystem II stability/assembly factor-like uncharacterized protein
VEMLIGTSEGAYLASAAGPPRQAVGLGGRHVRVLRRANGNLFAGADDGVYCSRDGGRSWQPGGVEGQTVWEIAVAPADEDLLYVGVQPAAVYRSRDGGDSWAEVESLGRLPVAERWGLPNSTLGARALSILLDPEDPARYQVGLEVGGILSTEDDGATWTWNTPGGNPDIHALLRDPRRSERLYATTGFGRVYQPEPREQRVAGLFGSEDGGQTWRYLWQGIHPPYTRPICADPRAPYALTVASAPGAFASIDDPGGAQAMLFQSTDDGHTWRSLGDAAHSPSAANLLAMAPAPEAAGSVVVGTETGEVWQVSPAKDWTLLANGLPRVQALLPLD